MRWLETLAHLKEPSVLVTIARVRGHAPRHAGSKMVVTSSAVYGSVGGGNLEQTALEKARVLLKQTSPSPELLTMTLSLQHGSHGVQCCGGEVTLLLEPVNLTRPSIAIFGAGHVGRALVQVLGMLPLELFLVDSRAAQLEVSPDLEATLHKLHAEIPETVLETLPRGTHLLVMTHDHAEDIAILDTALRQGGFGFIGLIGSSAKWAHFQRELEKQGHSETALKRVTTPIGLPGVPGKSPQAIAIATAAQVLTFLELPEESF